MTLPLQNTRVLDLTRLLPGAVCTLMLADLGADVIKVEDPNGGDYMRWMPPLIDGQSVVFRTCNRGKRSVIIDLKAQEGRALLHKLVESADVLVEGFRPGVMARLGCDYDALQTVNSRLVYCALSGWGADGPYAQNSGHDLNYTAAAGLNGAMEMPQVMGGQVADIGGAYIGMAGILAALLRRESTGEGGFVDTSLSESALPFALYNWVEALALSVGGGQGALTGGRACYRVYTAKDGRPVTLAALEPKFWANFCNAGNRPDLIDNYLKPERQPTLIAAVSKIFATRAAAEWDALLSDANCCFALVDQPGDAANNPHYQWRGALGLFDDGTPWMRSPLRLSNSEPVLRNIVPGYGEHTGEVLAEAGFMPEEIARLDEQGIIRRAS
jgi:alpha-methylacyl-CoA racemase